MSLSTDHINKNKETLKKGLQTQKYLFIHHIKPLAHAAIIALAIYSYYLFYNLLPGVKSFEVDSCSGNNLLPQLQVFPQSLDHWKRGNKPKFYPYAVTETIFGKMSLVLEDTDTHTICKENLQLPVLLFRQKLQVFLPFFHQVLLVENPLQTLVIGE